MARDPQAVTQIVAATDAGLARCLRRCNDLEAQLRHAVAEQERIRQTLQARLTAVTQAAGQARREQEGHIRELLAQRERSEAELSALQDRFAALSSAHAGLTASLEESEQSLQQARASFEASQSALESSLSQLRTERDELRRDLAATQAKAEALRREQDAQVERLRSKLVQVDLNWHTRHLAELTVMNDRLAATEFELRGVYQSLSWRLTTPLRMINRLFRWRMGS